MMMMMMKGTMSLRQYVICVAHDHITHDPYLTTP
jgi:hypothetical protein